MSLLYRYLGQDEQDDAVARSLLEREREHHNYELNRLNYTTILLALDKEDLPAEWPDRLRPYARIFGEALADALFGDDYTLATRLQFRDRIRLLLATTVCEQQKVEHVYRALEEQLPEGERRDAAIARARSQEELSLAARPQAFLRLLAVVQRAIVDRFPELEELPQRLRASRNGVKVRKKV